MTHEVAKTILAQLGGNKFVAMTGARDFCGGADMLSFRLPRNPKRIDAVVVRLDANDTYTVEFMRKRPFPVCVEKVATHDGIYCDMLQSLFTDETGLETRL